MGTHLTRNKDTSKRHKRGYTDSRDITTERLQRISFKRFVAEMEERLLEEVEDFDDLSGDESTDGDEL